MDKARYDRVKGDNQAEIKEDDKKAEVDTLLEDRN